MKLTGLSYQLKYSFSSEKAWVNWIDSLAVDLKKIQGNIWNYRRKVSSA